LVIEIGSFLTNHNSRFKTPKNLSNKITKVFHLNSYKAAFYMSIIYSWAKYVQTEKHTWNPKL
jgi:hypothetical protein